MQTDIQHKDLASGKWATMTFAQQMGNVGSEVGRAISWRRKDDSFHKEKALERAFELLDLTVDDRRWSQRTYRIKELLRVREVLADFFYGDNLYRSRPEDLEKYFYYFAFEARKNI